MPLRHRGLLRVKKKCKAFKRNWKSNPKPGTRDKLLLLFKRLGRSVNQTIVAVVKKEINFLLDWPT